MPGLNQIKQFSSDILHLGDEEKIRAARGEKPVTVPLPEGISEEDDSEDFQLGLPESDLAPAGGEADEAAPDMSDLVSADMSLDDLNAFDAGEEADDAPEEESASAGDAASEDGGADSSDPFGLDGFDLDDLPGFSSGAEDDGAAADAAPAEEAAPAEAAGSEDGDDAALDVSLPDAAGDDALEGISMNEGLPTEFNEVPPEADAGGEPAAEPEDDLFGSFAPDMPAAELETPAADGADSFDFSLPEDAGGAAEEPPAGMDAAGMPSAEAPDAAPADDADGFSLPDIDGPLPSVDDLQLPDDGVPADSGEENGSFDPDTFEFSLPEDDSPSGGESPAGSAANAGGSDGLDDGFFNMDDIDLPDYGPGASSGGDGDAPAPGMDDMDFSAPLDSDFQLGDITATEGGDDDYDIPGFSDSDSDSGAGSAQPGAARSAAGKEADEKKPRNSFTDAEYNRFRKNLAEYPLNVRIALEDLVVKNEFTDDTVFDILDKVLRRVPARQLASQLEKLLDISLDVPRDFERRSASEYEAYKQSVEYQLKNRIIPGAILTAGAAVLILCTWFLFNNLIWKPTRANSLYKEGYALIAENQYPQSEERFNDALVYRSVRGWFFKYADRYREHKQYDRAGKMYRHLLMYYNHDKQAGLDYADMEMSELYNYEEAERILKREVLDYHNNDPDAILKLGDLYLAWADDTDSTKYPLAKEQYDLLLELYGASKELPVYQARQMRYYIKMDNLSQVLQYKSLFYPRNLKPLSAEDMAELSGYLLDKRFGVLRPQEESLRTQIEDVRDLLEKAIQKDPANPVALYNMGRYYVYTSSHRGAMTMFQEALDAFKGQTRRSRNETYKFINTYRLLGEEFSEGREYIRAQQTYNDGIALFESVSSTSAFASDENVGRLYADLGDVNYFINGDMEAALDNYVKSINNKNDTASVRYRIGYIQYTNKNYTEAWGSFVRGLETNATDEHLLLALANTLSLRNDNMTAQGYYDRLLNLLSMDFQRYRVMLPQVRQDQGDLVETYMKATNNLGVTQSRLASLNGDSDLNGHAITNMQESLRAWDTLTRNQETMIRLNGSNLAEQNIKYLTNPSYGYEPSIYTDIPMVLFGEEGLEQ